MTTFHLVAPLAEGARVTLPESAAHHARVRRLGAESVVQVSDGRGRIATGRITRITRAALDVGIETVREVPRLSTLELYPPVADRDRMLWLAEKATELGITAWRPVLFQRSRSVSPRGAGDAFAAKVRARMVNALEQSGGAWLPDVHPEVGVDEAAEANNSSRLLLDAAGSRLSRSGLADDTAVLLGPEGGVEAGERRRLLAAGWHPVALSPNILRFETAGVAALAVIRAAQIPIVEGPHG